MALMMATNPIVEDVNLVLFSLANVSRQLAGEPPLPTPRSFSERLPFGLCNSASIYAREMYKAAQGRQPMSQFVGMVGSHSHSVHDLLCYEDPLGDCSSKGDNVLVGASVPPRVCAMAGDSSDSSPEVVPSQQTHAPSDHRAQALANAQAHAEDLRLRWWHTPPPEDQPSRAHSGSKGGNLAGSTQQRARGQPRHHQ
jgi:hypothetical protein